VTLCGSKDIRGSKRALKHASRGPNSHGSGEKNGHRLHLRLSGLSPLETYVELKGISKEKGAIQGLCFPWFRETGVSWSRRDLGLGGVPAEAAYGDL